MGYIRLDEQPGEVYHYTHRKNLDSILRDGRIRRMGDRECWFCASLEDTLTLMRATVMMEGKPYYKVGGSIGRYPKFVPEDYVILRLNPRFQKGEWVQWMQEMPPGSPPELLKAAETFSNLKLGFRGDLKFQQNPEVIEVAPLVEAAQTQFLDISFFDCPHPDKTAVVASIPDTTAIRQRFAFFILLFSSFFPDKIIIVTSMK